MLEVPTTLGDLLTDVANTLSTTVTPDDLSVRQAMLLAAHAATATADGPAVQDWFSYASALHHAFRALQADPIETPNLLLDAPAAGPDSVELRHVAAELVKRLADLYATAAAGSLDSAPHRRTTWARLAHYLDDASAELM